MKFLFFVIPECFCRGSLPCKNNKGQAFLEGVFILPVVVVLIFSVVWFARVLLTWQQLVSATRYGTDMISNTSLSKEDIKKDIENYLRAKLF